MTHAQPLTEDERRKRRKGEILEDGQAIRVPFMCADGMSAGVQTMLDSMSPAERSAFLTKHGKAPVTDKRPDGPRLHQPGSRYATSPSADQQVVDAERITSRAMYERALADAWKEPPPGHPPQGAPGPELPHDPLLSDADNDQRASALAARDEHLRNAWRQQG